jgi:NAD+ synthase (glutamine-hydrolysing)
MKIALAQINPTVGDFAGNARLILEFTARAAKQSADLAIFPELAICGYPPADLLEKSAFLARAQQTLDGIAASTATGPAILCGTALAADGNASGKRARNVAALLSGGRVTFLQQKMLLPFYDVFDEQRYFEPAQHQSVTMLDGQPLAITVCEDARAAADSNIRVHWMSLGELSRLIGTFQAEGITRAVMAGQVKPDQWRKG